jgi:hypothetical protein
VGVSPLVVPFVLAVLLCGVFCLFPLAIYLLRLGHMTRREHPTAISGTWDFVGLLFGLSGFILFGGGIVLTLLQSNFRFWMRGNFEGLRALWVQERLTWGLIVLTYLLVVVGSAVLAFMSRRRNLVVYNVEPAAFERLLAEIFDQMGRPIERHGKLWIAGEPLLELDTFERGRTVTLRWVSDDQRLFEEVDRQLRTALTKEMTDHNPATSWLMVSAMGCGVAAACCLGLLFVFFAALGGR